MLYWLSELSPELNILNLFRYQTVRAGGAVRRYEMTSGSVVVDVRPGAEAEVDPRGWLLKAQ